jgi:hypothetical protein
VAPHYEARNFERFHWSISFNFIGDRYFEWAREVDKSPPSSVEFKNTRICLSISPYIFTSYWLFTETQGQLYVLTSPCILGMQNHLVPLGTE